MSSDANKHPNKHPAQQPAAAPAEAAKSSNFLRQIIESDLEQGTYAQRHWGGSPGDAAHHERVRSMRPASAPAFRPSPMATCT